MATGLRNASFEDCTIARTGAHAIWLAAGCEDVRIQRCHIHDLGGGGVYIGGGWGVQENTPTQRIVVDNNFIHDGSYLFHGAHGVWIGRSSCNKVTHNEISNFDYSGISCGWSWGFQPSSANHNNLDYNHIHHLGNGDGLGDMGGIYTLGRLTGAPPNDTTTSTMSTTTPMCPTVPACTPTKGSSEILIENNVVYRVRTCPLFQHYGKDNIVRNNVFAFGGKGQLQRCREDKPCHYIAEGNIVYADIEQMLGGVWKSGDWKIGKNVYWSTAGPPEFAGMDFETWQEKGKDVGSIVADPLFVDAENDDFRLKPDSPALKLGFKPIDLSKTGLYGDDAWSQLPKQYNNRPLNEIPAPVEPPFVVNFDFEAEEPGTAPLDGKVVDGGKPNTLVVSKETAPSGNHSLKFHDVPGLRHKFAPHLYYKPSHSTGKVHLAWDMLNSREKPARLLCRGPAVGCQPLSRWPHRIRGPRRQGHCRKTQHRQNPARRMGPCRYRSRSRRGQAKDLPAFTLSIPGRDPIIAEVPYVSENFEKITWLGVSSNSDSETVFYLDNLKLGTAEQLANPPKRQTQNPARQSKAT